MDDDTLRSLLAEVAAGTVSAGEAADRLRRLPFADLGHARVDHHRHLRQGLPEVVYGPGKTPTQCAEIVAELVEHGFGPVILTRADIAQSEAALASVEGGTAYGRTLVWRPSTRRPGRRVVVAAAGTADLPVAEEAIAVLEAHGIETDRLIDVGVAGIHRLLAEVEALTLPEPDALIVVAGMEGALASVVGGLVASPVVAVPTSVGYGAALDGVTALLAMLSSCAPGVTVVGIDNGFGAAMAVLRQLGAIDRAVIATGDAT